MIGIETKCKSGYPETKTKDWELYQRKQKMGKNNQIQSTQKQNAIERERDREDTCNDWIGGDWKPYWKNRIFE